MKKSLIMIGCAVFTMGLAGCGFNNNAANDRNDDQQRVQTLDMNRGAGTEGQRLQVANEAERMIERMDEVQDARVIISKNNAYVAVRLTKDGRAGIYGDNNGNVVRNGAMDGEDGTFAENGRVNQKGNNGIIDGRGDAGNKEGANARINQNDSGMNRMSGALEQKISAKVREAHKGLDNVYVSLDNNLYNTMGTFADDIRTDKNRDGLFNDFTNAMDGFFGR